MAPLYIYLLIINATGFLLMLIDKEKAKKTRWRIPESVLIGSALMGGSLGCYLGMYAARHKTRKPLFYVGVPIILSIQILAAIIAN